MQSLTATVGPLIAQADLGPFCFFGHSAGALMAFSLTTWLERHGQRRPSKLLVSASRAPRESCIPFHHLPNGPFRQCLAQFGGLPPEVATHEELMQLLMPAFRADVRLAETYCSDERTHCEIVAFGGTEDPHVSTQSLRAWQAHTRSRFSLTFVPGGHFYIKDPVQALPYIAAEVTEPMSA